MTDKTVNLTFTELQDLALLVSEALKIESSEAVKDRYKKLLEKLNN